MGRPACQGALRLPLSERACVAPLSAKARPLNLRSRLFAVGQDIKCIHGTAHRTSREDRSEGPIDRPCRSGPRKPTPEPRPACGPTYSARGTPELEHDSVTCTAYKSSKTARWSSGTLKLAVGLPSPRYSAPVLFKGRPRFPASLSFVNVALVPFLVLGVRLSVESHRRSRSACSSTVWCWYCASLNLSGTLIRRNSQWRTRIARRYPGRHPYPTRIAPHTDYRETSPVGGCTGGSRPRRERS